MHPAKLPTTPVHAFKSSTRISYESLINEFDLDNSQIRPCTTLPRTPFLHNSLVNQFCVHRSLSIREQATTRRRQHLRKANIDFRSARRQRRNDLAVDSVEVTVGIDRELDGDLVDGLGDPGGVKSPLRGTLTPAGSAAAMMKIRSASVSVVD